MRILILTVLALMINSTALASDIVVTFNNDICQATVAGDLYRCSIGRNGITNDKHEGDGKTPMGEFALRRLFYRADKISKSQLHTQLPIQAIKPTDGWCDDPKNKQYNTLVDLRKFDLAVSHEDMYRKDDIYDIVIEVGYNDDPIAPGKGSAIFIHVARPNYTGTAGCIAFSQKDLLEILSKLNTNSKLIVR